MTRARGGLPRSILIASLGLALTSLGSATLAQTLSVEDAEEYLGTWTLAATFQETPVELLLEIVAEEGEVKAALGAAFQPEAQLIDSIILTAEGIELAYDANFGGNSLRVEIKAALEAGALVGNFGDQTGLFTADFTGTRATEPAGIVAEAALAAAEAAQSPQPSRRFGSLRAKLALEGGGELIVLHGDLKVDSQDHLSLLATETGEVFSYGGSRTMKLLTDADLVFGETRVPAHNLAPDYPGTYALWLKRVQDGWHLVFNTQADMWGSQYEPNSDVAEIPLEITELEISQEELLVELTAEEGGGRLRIVWGNSAWSAPFRVD